jgi:hypothetical protein
MTLIASFALVWLAVAAGAHPGHEHKILGTLTMAASDHVMLKDKDGKEVTVYVNSETKVFKDKEPRKVEDIENGMRVVVTAVTQKENEKEKMMAKTIELGSAPEAKQ